MNSTLNKKVPTVKEVEQFIYELFECTSPFKGERKGLSVTLDTLCCDFFPPDRVREARSNLIGGPIEEKFELNKFELKDGMPYHKFIRLGKQEKAFYKKYPESEILTLNYPLRKFAEMIYDLCLIKNHMSIS